MKQIINKLYRQEALLTILNEIHPCRRYFQYRTKKYSFEIGFDEGFFSIDFECVFHRGNYETIVVESVEYYGKTNDKIIDEIDLMFYLDNEFETYIN